MLNLNDYQIWGSLTAVVALDSLHDFESRVAALLQAGNRGLEENQQFLTPTEAGNHAKRATGIAADLAILSCVGY